MTELNKAGLEAARFAYEAPTLWDRAPTVRLQAAILAYLNALPDHIADASTMLPPAVGTVEPVAWVFELARVITSDREYTDWGKPQLSFTEPSVPEGSIRNLRPLYPSPPVPVTSGVRGKPLEWVKHHAADLWRADTLWGRYQVYAVISQISWAFDGYDGITRASGDATSIEDAKAAAQAHFDDAVRSTLLPVEEATGDRNAVLEEAAKEWLAARMATLAEPVPDMRTSSNFKAALNRLSEAEDALAKAIRTLKSTPAEPTEAEVEAAARAAYFEFVDARGYPNGLATWDELPLAFPDKPPYVHPDGQHTWRAMARAALKAARMVGAV